MRQNLLLLPHDFPHPLTRLDWCRFLGYSDLAFCRTVRLTVASSTWEDANDLGLVKIEIVNGRSIVRVTAPVFAFRRQRRPCSE